MNDLTRDLVRQVAEEHKGYARNNDKNFYWKMHEAWWYHMIDVYGVDMQHRFYHLIGLWHPGWFDEDGFLRSYEHCIAEIEIIISHKIRDLIEWKAAHDPELRLDDWGDLPVRIAEPQIRMF